MDFFVFMKQMLIILTVLAALGCQSQNQANMKQEFSTIEVVTFKVKPELTLEEAKEKLKRVNKKSSIFFII